MGNSEDGKSCKPQEPSSPSPDRANIHVYPDWAAMQAYYGPRFAVPPYFNSAVASGHVPQSYMWGPPQPMMPPYGAPYAAIYSHGGVYVHPGVPIAATPLNMDTAAKSSGNSDQGLMKKLKGFDGLAMTIGNGNVDSAEIGADHGLSRSGESEGSISGSDKTTAGAGQNGKKRSREATPNPAGKTESHSNAGEVNGALKKMMDTTVAPATVVEKVMGTVLAPSMTTGLELSNSPAKGNTSPTSVPQPCAATPNEARLQEYQNERELKREKRKQSNRESARRSRLRKQAEAEELAITFDSLTAENTTLKSEINRLRENSEKMKLENAALMEKLKNELGRADDVTLSKVDDKRALPLSTENLLLRVRNSASVNRSDEEGGMHEKNSGAKLHQLLDASPRTDAVAAG